MEESVEKTKGRSVPSVEELVKKVIQARRNAYEELLSVRQTGGALPDTPIAPGD